MRGSIGLQWLPPDQENKYGSGGYSTSWPSEGERRREGVESPCNTRGPLLQWQETREIFSLFFRE